MHQALRVAPKRQKGALYKYPECAYDALIMYHDVVTVNHIKRYRKMRGWAEET
jgi:hypothetical protein